MEVASPEVIPPTGHSPVDIDSSMPSDQGASETTPDDAACVDSSDEDRTRTQPRSRQSSPKMSTRYAVSFLSFFSLYKDLKEGKKERKKERSIF